MTLPQPIINEKWRCIPASPWQSEVVGFVDKVLINSCIIRIVITDKGDDHLIDEYHGKIVISKKAMVEKIS
ncbi:hypothetical protein D922_01540 [Enterococcus faecalis 06-MB-DW-09]|jgi:hypothetical protein|nr:hypothetical protein D922_01540 [Enterococcus faecalis 06-MB-DW-09]